MADRYPGGDDKLVTRADAFDAWTRELELRLPVHQLDEFQAHATTLRRALNYLSGDHWTLRFEAHPLEPPTGPEVLVPAEVDAVSLFSGGLDSLAGAIDQLADGRRIVAVAHFDAGITPRRQTVLGDAIKARYGDRAVALRRLVLRPQGRPEGLDHALPAASTRRA